MAYHQRRWGVILAGGEGLRLRSFTRFVSGDDRPKQFCALLGGQSLFAETRRRIAPVVPPDQTLFVLLRSHEPFYREELSGASVTQMVVQPANRGTMAAIALSLSRLERIDPGAIVAFFPSDHHYGNEPDFVRSVESAFEAVEDDPERVLLLGAPATHASPDLGWIEMESSGSGCAGGVRRVARFWEKPSPQLAQLLLERGCVWNTFVMFGRAGAFRKIIRSEAPDFFEVFRLLSRFPHEVDYPLVSSLYGAIRTAHFSQRVLASAARRLGVLPLGSAGWNDLGDLEGLLNAMREIHAEEQCERITRWRHRTAAPKTATAGG
jgi:mannose-1-phosphate guanylyltransferase